MTILIRREKVEVDCVRSERDIQIPAREDVDFLIDNNGTIDSAANLLNVLVNFDFFNKPSHVVQSLNDKIEQVEQQCRFIKDIRNSLYEQLWYRNEVLYKKLCTYVENKINEEFDFDITITPDTKPEIYDGYLHFNVQGRYGEEVELYWDLMNNLVARMSVHAHTFCKENNCTDMEYRLVISERWAGEDKYV